MIKLVLKGGGGMGRLGGFVMKHRHGHPSPRRRPPAGHSPTGHAALSTINRPLSKLMSSRIRRG